MEQPKLDNNKEGDNGLSRRNFIATLGAATLMPTSLSAYVNYDEDFSDEKLSESEIDKTINSLPVLYDEYNKELEEIIYLIDELIDGRTYLTYDDFLGVYDRLQILHGKGLEIVRALEKIRLLAQLSIDNIDPSVLNQDIDQYKNLIQILTDAQESISKHYLDLSGSLARNLRYILDENKDWLDEQDVSDIEVLIKEIAGSTLE